VDIATLKGPFVVFEIVTVADGEGFPLPPLPKLIPPLPQARLTARNNKEIAR
jgi:hypothetical protein